VNREQPLSDAEWADAELVWDYHQMKHQPQPCSAAIALGCNDIGVADYAAELYHQGLFPVVVFSGANSNDTHEAFPRGEAVHFQERARELGVPDDAMLLEPDARNTGDNIVLSRKLLGAAGRAVESLLLISMPYMERRAYATCRKLWPEVAPVCVSAPLTFEKYLQTMGNDALVVDMMIGDFQRVMEYPKRGFAIEQDVPAEVIGAYERLVAAGFTSRLLR
jgi:uncharacterized SAM-binding protein YcdF (DUF218 family)